MDLVIIPYMISPEQAAQIGEGVRKNLPDCEGEVHAGLNLIPNYVFGETDVINPDKIHDYVANSFRHKPILFVTSLSLGKSTVERAGEMVDYRNIDAKVSDGVGVLTTHGTDQISQNVLKQVADALLRK